MSVRPPKRKRQLADSDDEEVLELKTEPVSEEEGFVEMLISDDEEDDATIGLASSNDFSHLVVNRDAERRPLTVLPNGRVFLETFSNLYQQACDFLIAIAEPVSRPHFIHEFRITQHSLQAAASLGLTTDEIVSTLKKLSKVDISPALAKYIEKRTSRCGKVKLLLHHTRYFVESQDPKILARLLKHPLIAEARQSLIDRDTGSPPSPPADSWTVDPSTGFLVSIHEVGHAIMVSGRAVDQRKAMGIDLTGDDETDESSSAAAASASISSASAPMTAPLEPSRQTTRVFAFEINGQVAEQVRAACMLPSVDYPLLEEYDFRGDTSSPHLPIESKSGTDVRDYQEKSLAKMFGNGRARSGIIVLPCGAGKTLVGITASITIGKSTLVFCNTAMSVIQWRNEFLKWSTVPSQRVYIFTGDTKDDDIDIRHWLRQTNRDHENEAIVLITTFNMIGYNGRRSADTDRALEFIRRRVWGLVLLDEVHVAPAQFFRKCVSHTHSRCKLGLTATLVREDDLVKDLFHLVGPKLYEANWLDLQAAGYLAHVQCFDVQCAMSPEYFMARLSTESAKKRALLSVCNPSKFRACEYLIQMHESRGDQILVFSDNIFALEYFALKLHKPYIYGKSGGLSLSLSNSFTHSQNLSLRASRLSLTIPKWLCEDALPLENR